MRFKFSTRRQSTTLNSSSSIAAKERRQAARKAKTIAKFLPQLPLSSSSSPTQFCADFFPRDRTQENENGPLSGLAHGLKGLGQDKRSVASVCLSLSYPSKYPLKRYDKSEFARRVNGLLGDSHDRQIHVYRKVTMEIFLRATKICPRESKVSMAFLPADALICGHFHSYEAVRSYYRTVVLNPGCLAFVFWVLIPNPHSNVVYSPNTRRSSGRHPPSCELQPHVSLPAGTWQTWICLSCESPIKGRFRSTELRMKIT